MVGVSPESEGTSGSPGPPRQQPRRPFASGADRCRERRDQQRQTLRRSVAKTAFYELRSIRCCVGIQAAEKSQRRPVWPHHLAGLLETDVALF